MVISLLFLFFKGSRLIFILLSLELLMMSMLFYLTPALNETQLVVLIVVSVLSSVTGILVMVITMLSYGEDLVGF